MIPIERFTFYIKTIFLKRYWKKKNSHNRTSIGSISNRQTIDFIKNGGVLVGKNTYGKLNIHYSCGKDEKLLIGNNCSISGSCHFLLGGEHKYTCISTFPFAFLLSNYPTDVCTKGPIIVDDEVWIGDGAWMMSGISIGKGAIIGAGSIVTKDVPPYAIVAGNPAKVIKMRFPQTIIDKLMRYEIDLTEVSKEQQEALSEEVTEDNVDHILSLVAVQRRGDHGEKTQGV